MKALGRGSIASIVRVGLQVAWVLLWVAAACLLLAALGWGLMTAGVLSPELIRGDGGADFDTRYGPTGIAWTIVLPALMVGIVAVGGGLVIVWRLRKLFDSFSSGEPFRRENAQHLRVIWIALLIIELSRYALLAVTGALFAVYGDPGLDADFSLNIDISTWASILILIVLAEVFREGARMKEEQELTI